MGKLMNGPDVTDSLQYLATVDREARCTSTILLQHGGGYGGLPVDIVCIAVSVDGTVDGPLWETSVEIRWPSKECRTFEGALYRAVVELDKKMSDMFHQRRLPTA